MSVSLVILVALHCFPLPHSVQPIDSEISSVTCLMGFYYTLLKVISLLHAKELFVMYTNRILMF